MPTLCALSQTCKRLHSFTLPLIWAVTDVFTVAELGKLREVLRTAPHIATHIRTFRFSWDMDDDFGTCEGYTKEEAGSLLDLAFVDRQSLWEGLLHKHNGKLECYGGTEDEDCTEGFTKWFDRDERRYVAPGWTPSFERQEDGRVWKEYDPHTRNKRGNGPDGDGEDKLIKSSAEFNDCVTEIVSQLTSSLQTLGWECPVTTMAAEAVDALAKLKSITALHIDVSTCRGLVHACECYLTSGGATSAHAREWWLTNTPCSVPYWHLARSVEKLSFDFIDGSIFEGWPDVAEQDETMFSAFELPDELPSTKEAIGALNLAVVSRTIIAAAQSGRLKQLRFRRGEIQIPFAIRSLLPFWETVEFFNERAAGRGDSWILAAAKLRTPLSHASRWLGAGTEPRKDRRLTGQDVQVLQKSFEVTDMPMWVLRWGVCVDLYPVKRYLPWLAADQQLSQQVADAWNAIVARGETKVNRCYCDQCEEATRGE